MTNENQQDRTRSNRSEALVQAMNIRQKEASVDDVLKEADKFFKFLEGEST